MPRLALPPHVHRTVRRGHEYYTYQRFRGTARAGPRTKLPGAPQMADGSLDPAWWAAYRAADGKPAPSGPKSGSFRALAEAWTGTDDRPGAREWRDLKPNTRRNYGKAVERILAAWGDLPVRGLTPADVLAARDAMEDMPQAFNTFRTALSSMLSWSIPRGWRSDNPCEHVRPYAGGAAWEPWPLSAIEAWRQIAAPELARVMMLALYTGQRRCDLIRMSWADVDAGAVQVVQEKTKKRAWIPLHRELRAELASARRTSTRILVGESGRPWTLEGLKTAWQRQHECVELVTGDCHGLVLHGLRKSAVCFLLEAGCSEEEVEAITRQSRDMIRHYSTEMNRQRLAQRAIAKWEAGNGA